MEGRKPREDRPYGQGRGDDPKGNPVAAHKGRIEATGGMRTSREVG